MVEVKDCVMTFKNKMKRKWVPYTHPKAGDLGHT